MSPIGHQHDFDKTKAGPVGFNSGQLSFVCALDFSVILFCISFISRRMHVVGKITKKRKRQPFLPVGCVSRVGRAEKGDGSTAAWSTPVSHANHSNPDGLIAGNIDIATCVLRDACGTFCSPLPLEICLCVGWACVYFSVVGGCCFVGSVRVVCEEWACMLFLWSV